MLAVTYPCRGLLDKVDIFGHFVNIFGHFVDIFGHFVDILTIGTFDVDPSNKENAAQSQTRRNSRITFHLSLISIHF
jgi:hypothetical protein